MKARQIGCVLADRTLILILIRRRRRHRHGLRLISLRRGRVDTIRFQFDVPKVKYCYSLSIT